MNSTFKCFVLVATSLFIAGCATTTSHLNKPVSFADLNGWSDQPLDLLKPSLLNSCAVLREDTFADESGWGTYKQWRYLCKELAQTPERQLRSFFEHNFTPMQIAPNQKGLFTGYYSPVIAGSLTTSDYYPVPLRTLPEDMIKVRPSDFNVSGKELIGQVQNGYLTPYKDREAIEQQLIGDEASLLWLTSAEDKFFLQVQGSGTVQLEDGTIIHVGYAGNNGQDYISIGKVLQESGELTEVSMQSIKQWLKDNPDKQQWLFNQNPRYIFFKQNDKSAITSQGVPAVSNRTLAVDPTIVPLGMPVWLDTTLSATGEKFRRLMVAQDTGSAIKGAARGDIYLGIGKAAAILAGQQESLGKMYVLVPKSVTVEPEAGGQ
ncbi:hypothetical protein ACH42_07635 [Endozoicomonas sp. (ex Bugula neritina AB1)]|nr:hypothetical protein ACH42_07635 [Endozoicomonas sp. (ex Bugula neritina AB1)]